MTQDQHDFAEHSRQFDNVPKDCLECEGTGITYESCCGDDMRYVDTDICPTCHEHCGRDGHTCGDCKGTGEFQYED